jgi:hypothetical protein
MLHHNIAGRGINEAGSEVSFILFAPKTLKGTY